MNSSKDNRSGRLFFALWPDPGIRKQLVEIQRRHADPSARMNHRDDLHVTLAFLGEVERRRMECLTAAASGIHLRPFTLVLDQVGSWRKPNIFWNAPSDTPGSLADLVSALNAELAHCGFTPEQRPYRPHVTLARKGAAVGREAVADPVVWRVDGFVLATSGGAPPAPRYRVLKKWPADS